MIWLTLISFPASYAITAFKRDWPGTAWLDDIPWPRLRRPRSGARNDTPARPRHAPAATGDAPEEPAPAGEGRRKSGDPRAAGAASPRGAQPSGRRAVPPLGLVWDDLAGRYRHAETGPMPVLRETEVA